MTIYCYDTEFLEDGKTIELISIGIVSNDGREYYAVNSDMDVDRIRKDSWLLENVWKHLPLRGYRSHLVTVGCGNEIRTKDAGILDTKDVRVKPKWVIANEVRDFLLAGSGEPELFAYYAAYDHVALAQLWGRMINLPEGIPMWTHDLMQYLEQMPEDFQKPPQDGDEHHALADARWNMKLLQAMDAA